MAGKAFFCLLIKRKEHLVLLGKAEAWQSFLRQGKPRKVPLNGLAPVQVPTKVREERLWEMGLGEDCSELERAFPSKKAGLT